MKHAMAVPPINFVTAVGYSLQMARQEQATYLSRGNIYSAATVRNTNLSAWFNNKSQVRSSVYSVDLNELRQHAGHWSWRLLVRLARY
jgi:hypothetical protein